MGLFGKWSKKRDQRDEERAADFNALLDRIEREHFHREEPEEKTPPEDEKDE